MENKGKYYSAQCAGVLFFRLPLDVER